MTSSTIVSAVFGIPAVGLNLTPQRPWVEKRRHAVFSLLVGAQGLGMGAVDGLHDRHLRGTGYFQLVTGATALTLGALTLLDGPPPARGAKLQPPTAARASLALRPGQTGEPQLGVAVRF